MKLDPLSLRLFVAVMEDGAIARAAAREHIAPSAASRRLAELEGQLQLELSTWATSPRIEKIAREKLKMRTPEPGKIITVVSGGGR